jgi:hypothetical protein
MAKAKTENGIAERVVSPEIGNHDTSKRLAQMVSGMATPECPLFAS